jgi:hypothetical protein
MKLSRMMRRIPGWTPTEREYHRHYGRQCIYRRDGSIAGIYDRDDDLL